MTPRRALAAGLVALGAAWAFAAPHTPPLYDGIGTDEPYRYVAPPPGYQHTPAPTAATDTVSIAAGQLPPTAVASGEVGPQVSVYLLHAGLHLPTGGRRLTLTATPAAPTTQPADGRVWGNVYRVQATTDAGPAVMHGTGDQSGLVELRSPSPPPPTPVMELDTGSGWHRIKTARIGNDIWAGPLLAFGAYAMVIPNHPLATGGGGGSSVLIILAVVALVAVAVAIALIRRSRRAGGGPTADH